MTLLKAVVPALAVVGGAYAQCSAKATRTLSSAADASSLASCNTFDGSLALATSISGDIEIPQVREITGSFSADGAVNVTSLSFPGLESIGSDFTLENLTQMTELSMPLLSSVGGALLWVTLNALQMLSFSTGLAKAGSINIRDTQLQTLDGLNLTQCNGVVIANNQYLSDISLDLTSVAGNIIINSNSQDTSCSFPRLTSARAIQIANCSSLDISSLKNVTQSAAFVGNYFNNFSAPKLTMSNGLVIQNNDAMKSVSLPVYTSSSGALNFINNIDLTGTITLPALTHVGGSANFRGNFSNVALPELNTISGTLTLGSSKDIESVCNHYRGLSGEGQPIRGKVNCYTVPTGTAAGGPSSTGGSSSSTSSGAAVANMMPASSYKVGLAGVLAAMFGYFV